MNIEDLTIKQARELSSIFQNKNESSILKKYIGKYVIVRSRNEGINAGYVENLDETGIILSKSRRIWYHKPKDKKTSWYEGVSISGLSEDSKVSVDVNEKAIVENYSITLCTKEAEESIKNHKANEQN